MLLKVPVQGMVCGGLVFCVLGGVDRALETLTRMMLRIGSKGEREFPTKKKAAFPFGLLLLSVCVCWWVECEVGFEVG